MLPVRVRICWRRACQGRQGTAGADRRAEKNNGQTTKRDRCSKTDRLRAEAGRNGIIAEVNNRLTMRDFRSTSADDSLQLNGGLCYAKGDSIIFGDGSYRNFIRGGFGTDDGV